MSEKKETLFRKKALDQIRSPEQMNEYLKVTNPSVWIILAAVIVLFAGLFAWASLGKLETAAPAVAVIDRGMAAVMLTDAPHTPLSAEMQVRLDGRDYDITRVERDESGRSVAYAPMNLEDGLYDAKVILETVSPLSFLIR